MVASLGSAYRARMRCQEVRLARVPEQAATAGDFEVADVEVGAAGPGQVLVGLRMLGLNAGLAHRLGGEGSAYGPAIEIGDVPASDAVVEVLESAHDDFQPGDLAVCKLPWRTAAVLDADALRRIHLPATASDDDVAPHLTVLGHVGFTAWTGMIHVGAVSPGESVCVSGAAGGVGSCAVQFAQAVGASVVGVVGSAEKVALLTTTLGADRAINRHDGPALTLLREAAPDGIDLYYDNVGGEQLEAALEVLNVGGRAVICGAVASQPGAPRNFRTIIYREITLRGFTVTAHEDLRDRFESEVGRWVEEGTVRSLHTVFEGFDRLPEAFESLLSGSSTGRVIVSGSQRSAP